MGGIEDGPKTDRGGARGGRCPVLAGVALQGRNRYAERGPSNKADPSTTVTAQHAAGDAVAKERRNRRPGQLEGRGSVDKRRCQE